MKKVIFAILLGSFMVFFVIGVWHFMPLKEEPQSPTPIEYSTFDELRSKIKQLESRFEEGGRSDWQTAYRLGVGYLHLGRPEDAIPMLEKAITLNPDFYKSYETLGMAYYRLGRLQSAIEVWQKALKVSAQAEHLKDMINRARFRLEAAQRIKQMEAIPEKDRDWAKRYELATLYIVVKDYDSALEELKKAIEDRPSSAELYDTLATVYALKGNYERAIESAQKALELRPEDDRIKQRLKEMRRLQDALKRGGYHTEKNAADKDGQNTD